jgi:hypothetical protein
VILAIEQTVNIIDGGAVDMQTLAELRAREQEVEREWQWLHGALNSVARVWVENGDTQAFRLTQAQAMAVGQRRVELRPKMADEHRVDHVTKRSGDQETAVHLIKSPRVWLESIDRHNLSAIVSG